MNFRRRYPREHGRRGCSSDWSYIKLEKGKSDRSKVSVRRRIEKTLYSMKEWLYG